jgi:hypothetical protein
LRSAPGESRRLHLKDKLKKPKVWVYGSTSRVLEFNPQFLLTKEGGVGGGAIKLLKKP